MNLLLALLLGIAFGFVLEQAGFSSSRKLTGLFYGTDFTVLRVFFTAGVTAMSGVLLLSHFGLLDTELIYINPTFLYPALVGGAIMGVGFVLGGYCPGTSFCGAAVGKIDAMAFIGGSLLGILAFGEAFPLFQNFYTSGAMGDLLVYMPLGLTAGQFALALIAMAVGAFVFTGRIERKVNPDAPSRAFPVRFHRVAAAGVLCLGAVLALTPDRHARLTAQASDAAYLKRHPVARITADELAFRLLDRDPRLLPVDLRSAAEFGKMSLPGAVNLPAAGLFGKEARLTLSDSRPLKVFFAQDEAAGERAAALARLLGYRNVAVLQGGMDGFSRTILNAEPGDAAGADPAVEAFRLRAAPQIAVLMKERGAAKPVKAVRRVQGGCGG
jgi:hypothetical protein